MPTLLPWSSLEFGDLDVFVPSIPSLLVYTWYEGDEPQSVVVNFWQDSDTGVIQSELLMQGPLTYDEALAWAQSHATKRDIARIHAKHSKPARKTRHRKAAKAKARKPARAKSKMRPAAKRRAARSAKRRP